MAKHDAEWTQIDTGTLTQAQQVAYANLRRTRQEAAKAREAFEASMASDVGEGMRMVFGYNFGKLSVAIVPDDRKVAKPAKGAKSLADYLAERRASGHGA